MKVYAQQNDTVDAICWRHMGATAGVAPCLMPSRPRQKGKR